MITEQHQLEVRGISVDVVRKDIKNLHLAVYPPLGRVRVAAPLHITDETVRLAVISRLAWIRKQQNTLTEQPRQSQREMVSGESHFYQGRRYLLDVIEEAAPPTVILRSHKVLELRVRPGADRQKREEILRRWYRRQLHDQIPGLLAKWQPIVGAEANACGVKRMKTKWGTYNFHRRYYLLEPNIRRKTVNSREARINPKKQPPASVRTSDKPEAF